MPVFAASPVAAMPIPGTPAGTMPAMAFLCHGRDQLPRAVLLPIPAPGPRQVLVRVSAAGVGHWDLLRRDGDFARRSGHRERFPLVAGAEAAGTVVATGSAVRGFRPGDRVYGMLAGRMARTGCFAGYVLFDETHAWPVPPWLAADQAAVLPVDGALALRGLRDGLEARAGQRLVILGASGGIGHLALQLARRMGLRTLAIASRADGVRLALRQGADAAIDGRRDDIGRAVRRFTGGGASLALLTAGGTAAEQVAAAMPAGSRVTWPRGVDVPQGIAGTAFAASFDPALLRDLHGLLQRGLLLPHVSRRFPLPRLAEALEAVTAHHLGRIAVLAP